MKLNNTHDIVCVNCKSADVHTELIEVKTDFSIRLKLSCGACGDFEEVKIYRPSRFATATYLKETETGSDWTEAITALNGIDLDRDPPL